jgi:nucleoid-associated protein YgaU
MEASTRIGVALCVLVAGVAIAGLFRKAPGPISSPADRAEIQLTLRQPSSSPATTPAAPPNDWRAAGSASAGEANQPPLASIPTAESSTSAPPLPLPRAPEAAVARAAASSPTSASSVLAPSADAPASNSARAGAATDDDWQLHEVVDGDTLAAVALRYYGDPALTEALLRANGELVKNPDILPIGAFLKIPSRSSVGPTTARGEGWRKAGGK